MGGDLEHRVLARVEDQLAAAQVLGAELLDRLDPVVGPVADHSRPLACLHAARRSPAGSRPDRSAAAAAQTTPINSQWPVVESLPSPIACSRPCRPASRAGGTPCSSRSSRDRAAAASAATAPRPRCARCAERVRAGVAVLRGVGQRADAAGVEHHHERSPHAEQARIKRARPDSDTSRVGVCARGSVSPTWRPAGPARRGARAGCASKYTSRSRSADRCV